MPVGRALGSALKKHCCLSLIFQQKTLNKDLVSTESEIFSIIMRKFSTSKVWISFCFYELSTIYPTFAGIGGVPRFVYGPFRGGLALL